MTVATRATIPTAARSSHHASDRARASATRRAFATSARTAGRLDFLRRPYEGAPASPSASTGREATLGIPTWERLSGRLRPSRAGQRCADLALALTAGNALWRVRAMQPHIRIDAAPEHRQLGV